MVGQADRPGRRPLPVRPARGRDRAELTPTRTALRTARATVTAPPLRLELSYAVTAWTKAVEDEHRLLSQVRRDPASPTAGFRLRCCDGPLAGNPRLREAETSVGRPREEQGRLLDFGRRSVQGLDRLRRRHHHRVGRVRVTRPGGADADAPRRGPRRPARTTVIELHRFGGTSRDPRRRAGGGRLGRPARFGPLDRDRPSTAASCSTSASAGRQPLVRGRWAARSSPTEVTVPGDRTRSRRRRFAGAPVSSRSQVVTYGVTLERPSVSVHMRAASSYWSIAFQRVARTSSISKLEE